MKFNNETIKIDPPKVRRITPVHAITKVERDRTKYTRKDKHKMSGETYGR